jgi:hypothetical protein
MTKKQFFTLFAVCAVGVTSGLALPGAARGAKPVARASNDGPIRIGNVTWHSKAEFIRNGGRCSTPTPSRQVIARVRRDLQRFQAANGNKMPRPTNTVNITIHWHVITNTSNQGNLTDQQIASQIAVLNMAYSGQDVGGPGQGPAERPTANTAFRFVLGSIDRTANDTWYNMYPGSQAESQAKNALYKGTKRDLNVYSADLGGGLLGWATFPWDYPSNLKLDGIVILYSSVPGGGAVPYDLGDTATHEIGHWLGLYHPFQWGCDPYNDEVSDTAAEASPFFGTAPPYYDSCTGGPEYNGRDPVENFMDYTDDIAMFQFTNGQAYRANWMAKAYRGM